MGASDLNTQLRDNLLFLAGTTGVLPSLHATTFTIDSGGLAITAGNVGVGVGAGGNIGLNLAGTITAAGGGADGIQMTPTLTAAANADSLIGIQIAPTYSLVGHTGITSYGILVNGVASGAVNNYGVYIGAPSGGTTGNIGLFVAGGGINVQSGGIVVSAGGVTVTGVSVFNSAVTFVGSVGIGGGLTVSSSSLSVSGDMIGGGEVYGVAGTTTATTGFVRIPAANGPPTGAVSSVSGRAAMYYDASNNQIYVWNGAWKKTVALT